MKKTITTLLLVCPVYLNAAIFEISGTVAAPTQAPDHIQSFFGPYSSDISISLSFDIAEGSNFNPPFDVEFTDFSGSMIWTNSDVEEAPGEKMQINLSQTFRSFGR